MDMEKFRMGWLMVCFDLPVMTKKQRKVATQFRKSLLDDGYQMIQYSVYARPCVTFSRQQTHLRRLETLVPNEGSVRAIFITRSQWERAYLIEGAPAIKKSPEKLPVQLQFW